MKYVSNSKKPFIVAIDYSDERSALTLADQLSPDLCRLKVGKELFTACGMSLIDRLHERGYEIFLDLKFHDIPNTVASAIRVIANKNIWMTNVHASGGERMLISAREAVDSVGSTTKLIGVTVLTSFNDDEMSSVGINHPLVSQVELLSKITSNSGLDGVVCSAKEAKILRTLHGEGFLLVTPGIRMQESNDDQRRTMRPDEAISMGSNYLVVGRPITESEHPLNSLQKMYDCLKSI